MIFFDQNNLILQSERYSNLEEAKDKKVWYQEQIVDIGDDLYELTNNQETLEKFAREKYRMKKDNEDLFIILDEEIEDQSVSKLKIL